MEEIELSAMVVLFLVSLVIPTLTGLITKSSAPAQVKQVVTLVLASANGVLVTVTQQDGTAIVSTETLLFALLSLFISITSYLGIYRPHEANDRLAPEAGLGGP
jgi:hypothetical protein